MDRRTRHDGLPAGEGTETHRNRTGVSGDHGDRPWLDTELLGANLGERGLDPLPDRNGARIHRHAARTIHPDRRGFKRAPAGPLQAHAHADADKPALLPRAPLALRKPRIVDGIETDRHHLGIVAAVIDDRRSGPSRQACLVRHQFRRNQVSPPDLGAIEAEFARDRIERALDGEVRRRIPGAANRDGRDLVGLGHDNPQIEGRQPVGTGQCGRGVGRQIGAARRVGALIVDHAAAHAEKPAVVIERGLHVPVLVAFLDGRQEILAPVLDPLHRPPEHAAGCRDDDLLRIDEVLGPEPASDVRGDHTDLILVQAKHGDQRAAHVVRFLGGIPDRQPVLDRIVVRQHGAAFDRMRAPAMRLEG